MPHTATVVLGHTRVPYSIKVSWTKVKEKASCVVLKYQ